MVTVDREFEGQRLDNFLMRELKGVPRTYVYKIVRKGEVRVNKGRVNAKYRLIEGDVVRIPPLRQSPAPTNTPFPALKSRLDDALLFENKDLIVLNKPSGMAVHGGSGVQLGCIEALRSLYSDAGSLELVHRLAAHAAGPPKFRILYIDLEGY